MMKKRSRLAAALTAIAMSSTLTACAVVWGFEDPQDPAESPALVGDGSIAEGRAPGCESQKVDETAGVFVVGGDAVVEAGATEDPLCGGKDTPCIHIATGLSRAKDLGRSLVYVVRGTYTESISMPSGMTLQGGWNALRTGGTIAYARACGEPPGTTVIIQAPENQATAVLVDDTAQPVTLDDLTIKSKTKPLASESVYGIRARGVKTTPQLTLTDVFVVSGPGGNGEPGKPATPGDAGSGACEPPFAASDGGDVPTGDGGAPAALPSQAKFGPDGIVASNGADGAPGARGNNGVAAAAPMPLSCFASCTPPTILGACTGNPGTPVSGKTGESGCGGAGGGGGHGGGGGGSSVAVYAWNANVTTLRGGLTAGNGGAGAPGSPGASGGAGALGANGADSASCTTGCGSGTLATGCSGLTSQKSAGTAGTKGSAGGTGGAGSPGAGGDSFAIALGGTAQAKVDPSTVLVVGTPGSAPPGGVTGKAAAKGAP